MKYNIDDEEIERLKELKSIGYELISSMGI